MTPSMSPVVGEIYSNPHKDEVWPCCWNFCDFEIIIEENINPDRKYFGKYPGNLFEDATRDIGVSIS